jgi:hypothetical protein
MVEPTENANMKYADEQLYFSFALAKKNPDRILLSVYNRTGSVVTIDWGQSSFIFGNNAQTVLPGSQIKSANTSYSAPSLANVPSGTRLEEALFVSANVSLITAPPYIRGGFGFGGWGHRSWGLLGFDDFFTQPSYSSLKIKPFFLASKNQAADITLTGYKFGLFLPVNIDGTQKNYRFLFEITATSTEISPGILGILTTDSKEQAILQTNDKPLDKGVLISALSAKSAAKKAGFLAGDVIIKIDGVEINDTNDFSLLLNQKKAKETLMITYLRAGKEYTLPVILNKA